MASIESLLAAATEDPDRMDVRAALCDRASEALPALAAHLRSDLPIDTLERYERVLKDLLGSQMSEARSGDRIRELALFQRDVGFLLKYKSYAIKAASPLGYSVFLQNAGEGFSFQRHIRHKTEIFYVLDVLPGGYVFICDFDDWERIYERRSFEAWLAGAAGLPYDRFRYTPRPGDVVVIDKLNVVHTVVGCALAEFATVSTDMVDRLYDQNQGRRIPSEFSREHAEDRLRRLSWPEESHRVVIGNGGVVRTPMPSESIQGGSRTILGQERMVAASYRYLPGAVSVVTSDPTRTTCLHVVQGRGQFALGTAEELRRASPPAIPVTAGNLLLVPPHAHYGFVNDGATVLGVAAHCIEASTAFVG